MAHFSLDIEGSDLTLGRDEMVVLRGKLDTSAGVPRITPEAGGWRIEHPDDAEAKDVFDLRTSGHWFGGQELLNQLWPGERAMLDAAPFITHENSPSGLSCVESPLWVASSGAAILADHDQVLRVGLNRSIQKPSIFKRDWLPIMFAHRPAPDDGTGDGLLRLGGRGLRYRVFAADDAVRAWRACLPHIGHPQSIPPETLWRKPIWTTWARFKMNINQKRVLRFADEIVAHHYPYGVMEIDDRWQAHYGDSAFDPKRFPNPCMMVDELHSRGFAVTCWVMPFVNPDADCFDVARARGYLLKQNDGSLLPVRWWQGNGYLLDVANAEALRWFGDNLRTLQQAMGLDGYKFDAGEANFAGGQNPDLAGKAGFWNDHTHRYVEFVAANFTFCEVRSGWGNQRAPIFFRQWDKWSTWGKDNGLASLITGMFALGLAGYPFVLPDMVGGNAYFTDRPSAELLIRWSQANALLPAIQFSLAPWDFGEECARLCRAALDVRERYLDHIATAMRQAASSGDPIIRPVWWFAPDDERAQVCDDEFLLGADVLVAPIVRPRQRARDVYLPDGQWKDASTGQVLSGPTVLTGVSVPLDTLPVYNRI